MCIKKGRRGKKEEGMRRDIKQREGKHLWDDDLYGSI